MKPIDLRIAEELGVRAQQVAAAISLLDSGATVPFVARYRKEATGALDDTQLRRLEERLRYLRDLDERRSVILDSISQQGKLDPALKQAIDAADSKARLEDLYLPYRPKRRTKAQIAREAGLEPLAEALLARPDQSPEQVALRYLEPNKGVMDPAAALEGARAILVERLSEDAMLIGTLREEVWSHGRLSIKLWKPGRPEHPQKSPQRDRRSVSDPPRLPAAMRWLLRFGEPGWRLRRQGGNSATGLCAAILTACGLHPRASRLAARQRRCQVVGLRQIGSNLSVFLDPVKSFPDERV